MRWRQDSATRMPLKTDLKGVISRIPEYAGWRHADKIKFFAWYLHVYEKKDRVNGVDIANCFDALPDERPSSITPFLASMEKKNPKEAIRDRGGYYLSKQVRDALDARYGEHDITLNICQMVTRHLADLGLSPQGYGRNNAATTVNTDR
jgi:hypothetical protein